jgi:hypothetical protein
MKYTEKFDNRFLTYEHEDLKKFSFSFNHIIIYILTLVIGFCVCLLLFGLGATLLGWILNLFA